MADIPTQHLLQLRDGRCFNLNLTLTPCAYLVFAVAQPVNWTYNDSAIFQPIDRVTFLPTTYGRSRDGSWTLWRQQDGPDMVEPPRYAQLVPTPAWARPEATRHAATLALSFRLQDDAF